MLNKKSQLEDLLPLLLLMVLLTFLLLFISCANTTKQSKLKEQIELQSLNKDSAQLMINFLRSPVVMENGQERNMADSISLYFLTEDKVSLNLLTGEAKKFFSTSVIETDSYFWSLEIKHPDGKTAGRIISDKGIGKSYMAKKKISTIKIPTSDPEKNAEINIFIFYIKAMAK